MEKRYTGDIFTYLHPQVLEHLHVRIKNNQSTASHEYASSYYYDILLQQAPKKHDRYEAMVVSS